MAAPESDRRSHEIRFKRLGDSHLWRVDESGSPIEDYGKPGTPVVRESPAHSDAVDCTPPHREVAIKVTAWVDEGVAPLAQAINEFLHVRTMQSCEGPAEVTFTYGEEADLSYEEVAGFALWLANEFAERREDAVAVTLVCKSLFRFFIRLQVEPDAVERVAAELCAMAHRFANDTPRRRMSELRRTRQPPCSTPGPDHAAPANGSLTA